MDRSGNETQLHSEWDKVAEIQKQRDSRIGGLLSIPIEKLRDVPYVPPPFPDNAPQESRDIEITQESVKLRDGSEIALRVYSPLPAPGKDLLVFNAHGGGMSHFHLNIGDHHRLTCFVKDSCSVNPGPRKARIGF